MAWQISLTSAWTAIADSTSLRVAGSAHRHDSPDQQDRGEAMGSYDLRARRSIVVSASAQRYKPAADDHRLYGTGEDRAQRTGGKLLLRGAKRTLMERSPKIGARQHGHGGRAHLGAEQSFAATFSRSGQHKGGTRPEGGGKNMKG
jgi:hypothetical protein